MKELEKGLVYCEKTGSIYRVSGSVRSDGYNQINYKGKVYYTHRFIWEKFHGPIPVGMVIDHINQNKNDNRIVNLRLVDNSENYKNLPLRTTSKSGVVGVYYSTRDKLWVSFISEKGKQKELGRFKSKKEATANRKAAEVSCGYHKNHGKIH